MPKSFWLRPTPDVLKLRLPDRDTSTRTLIRRWKLTDIKTIGHMWGSIRSMMALVRFEGGLLDWEDALDLEITLELEMGLGLGLELDLGLENALGFGTGQGAFT